MAIANFAHDIDGPCYVEWSDVTWSTAWIPTYDPMGVNRESIPVVIEPKYLDVETDEYGGTDGVPADSQMMFATAKINLNLTKYDKAAIEDQWLSLDDVASQAVVGQLVEPGTFVRQEGIAKALRIVGTNWTTTFEVAFLRGGFELNAGTKYRTYVMNFEACISRPTPFASPDTAKDRFLFRRIVTV